MLALNFSSKSQDNEIMFFQVPEKGFILYVPIISDDIETQQSKIQMLKSPGSGFFFKQAFVTNRRVLMSGV